MDKLELYKSLGYPTECPVCHSKLEAIGVDLVCTNPNCGNVQESDLEQWCNVICALDNIAWLTKKKYFDELNIYSIDDLFEYIHFGLDPEEEQKYISITDKKFLESLKKMRDGEFELGEVLSALNIQGLGRTISNALMNNKDSYEQIMQIAIEQFNNPESDVFYTDKILAVAKPAVTENIKENILKLKRVAYVIIKPFKEETEVSETNGTFCVTGKLESMKRNDLVKLAESKGWKFIGAVTKDCQYLVNNDKESGSSKNKKAKELGTKIITENEFLEMIGE